MQKMSIQPRRATSAAPDRNLQGIVISMVRDFEFSFTSPKATEVSVAGTFNNWDPKTHRLTRDKRGRWRTVVALPPGRHEYRFVVDGEWVSDPKAENTVANAFGNTNGVITL